MRQGPPGPLPRPFERHTLEPGKETNAMKLERGKDSVSSDATEADVRRAFEGDDGQGGFVILSESDQVFMQAAGEGDGTYTLEYREGDEARHYQCRRQVSRSVVQAAFLKYLLRDTSWKTDFRWTPLREEPWWKFW